MSLPHRTALALAVAALVSTSVAAAADFAAIPHQQLAPVLARGAQVVHDYGSFAWVRDSGQGVDTTTAYALDLGNRIFDPAADAAAGASVYGKGKALRLVQFDGPIKQEWLQQLQAAGVRPLQYIAPFSYVVWADDAALQRGRGVSAVRWSGDFLPQYKTANVLDGSRRGETQWHAMVYRGAAVSEAELRGAGTVPGKRVQIDREFEVIELEGSATAMEALAQLPGVYALEPVPRDGGPRAELANQITANNLNGSNLPVVGYLAWLTAMGVNGNGVKIANVDGGIFDTHPDLVNRMLPCTGDTCGGSATDAHGTHTAAIMAGDASSGTNDANGFKRGLGMAPGAKLVEQVYAGHFTQAGGMLKLMRQSYDNGADLSGNSWGPAGSPRGYDGDTRQVDVGTRDVNPTLAGDQPLSYVLSFMNGNGGTSSQGSPDEAKNVITVGSTWGQTSGGAADARIDDISSNSAHGPALDSRRIPHLVAPGCYVDSAASATGYQTMCGTSMASPQVSGAVALFIEKYRSTHAGTSPSTALIKASLVAATKDLNGRLDADGGTLAHRPDNKQGWGRLRADWLLGSANVLYYDQNTRTFDNTGEEWTVSVSAADPAKPVQLVLVYTDAPGHGLGGNTPAWNNDLDLRVTGGATTYLGNVFGANGYSTGGGTADAKNNIESVWLDAATASAAGALTVTVRAANITSDALPNSGDTTDQDFALVCTNCVSQPDYTVAPTTSAQAVCTTSTTTASYPVGIGSVMGYNTAVNLSLAGLPAGASGNVSPTTVTPPGTATIGLSSLNAVAAGVHTFQLNASSTSGNKTRDLSLTVATAAPAAPVQAAPANNATNVAARPTFSWGASAQGAEYVVEVATDAAFGNIVFTKTGTAISATPTSDLATNTVYYWRVRSTNICGSGSNSPVFQFTTAAAPGDCGLGSTAVSVFSDDVENGTNGWTTAVGSGTANWAISTARPYGGTGNAWLATDPAVVSDQRLTSPAIVLPTGQNPLTLQFQSDQTMEPNSNGGCWDAGLLEISTNGGSTFTQIPAAAMLTDPYNGAIGSGNPATGLQGWCGDPQAYLRSVVDLNAYAGQTVQLRFRMTSDTSIGRLPHGWYVDNIKVQSCNAAPQPDAIFANGFQN